MAATANSRPPNVARKTGREGQAAGRGPTAAAAAVAATTPTNGGGGAAAGSVDGNEDQRATVGAVRKYAGKITIFGPEPAEEPRLDCNGSGGITLADVMMYSPVMNMSCTP